MPSAGRVHYIESLPPPSARRRGVLLLLHAFPLNARMWEPQLILAARGWHVVAPQTRGFDGGLVDAPVASIDDYAADLIDLLDALHIEDAVVGGLSMGGYIAFALLRHAPHYVSGLILADTKSPADTPEAAEGRRRMMKLVRDKGVAAVADEMIPKLLGETTRATRPAVVERVRSLILSNDHEPIAEALQALMTRPDATPLLSSIRVPTLILVGEEDGVTPPAAAEEMHARVPGSELVRIPAAGHLSSLEQSDAFTDALARFLDHRI